MGHHSSSTNELSVSQECDSCIQLTRVASSCPCLEAAFEDCEIQTVSKVCQKNMQLLVRF